MEETEEKSAAREILDYERAVNAALLRHNGRHSDEPAAGECSLYAQDNEESESDKTWSIRNDTARRMFAYFSSDGPHPSEVLRRVFALGLHLGIAPFSSMSRSAREIALGDGPMAQRHRLEMICAEPTKSKKRCRKSKAP